MNTTHESVTIALTGSEIVFQTQEGYFGRAMPFQCDVGCLDAPCKVAAGSTRRFEFGSPVKGWFQSATYSDREYIGWCESRRF